jgi:hypothetical protein
MAALHTIAKVLSREQSDAMGRSKREHSGVVSQMIRSRPRMRRGLDCVSRHEWSSLFNGGLPMRPALPARIRNLMAQGESRFAARGDDTAARSLALPWVAGPTALVWLISTYSIGRPHPHTVFRSLSAMFVAAGLSLVFLARYAIWRQSLVVRAAVVRC